MRTQSVSQSPQAINGKVLIADFHDVFYDERFEYGCAIQAAINVWAQALEKSGATVPLEEFYRELTIAHRQVGPPPDDWSAQVWDLLPALAPLRKDADSFQRIKTQALQARDEESRRLTLQHAFPGVAEAFRRMKAVGYSLYFTSDGVVPDAAKKTAWLGLDGVVDGIYAWPSADPTPAGLLTSTFVQSYPQDPEHPEEIVRKPHPIILGQILFDHVKRHGGVPQETSISEVFLSENDPEAAIPELAAVQPEGRYARTRMTLKEDAPSHGLFTRLLAETIYLGNSKLKDGWMARLAGLSYAHAEFGKEIPEALRPQMELSESILLKVTGWAKTVLSLAQAASESSVVQALTPDILCQSSEPGQLLKALKIKA